MNLASQKHVEADSPEALPRKNPLRFKFGIGLLILYPLMWIFAAVVPFLPLSTGAKAAIVGVDLAAAEVILLLGIALVGKETYQAIKSRFRRKKHLDKAAVES